MMKKVLLLNSLKAIKKAHKQWHEYISNSFKLNLSNDPVEGKNN